MAAMEKIQLPHLERYVIYAAIFRDVQNASFLRDQLLEGNIDFEYAFIDASMVGIKARRQRKLYSTLMHLSRSQVETMFLLHASAQSMTWPRDD